MKIINRAVFVLRPQKPYLDWASSLDKEASATAESLRDHASVYLVPEDPTGQAETPPPDSFFAEIFEHELEAWCTDETRWPSKRDLKAFRSWFEVTGESIVIDLGKGPIIREDI